MVEAIIKILPSDKQIGVIHVEQNTKVKQVKSQISSLKSAPAVNRQLLRLNKTGKNLQDDDASLQSLGFKDGQVIYVKDLGPQISWRAVFLTEYLGPLVLYLLTYQQPWVLYGNVPNTFRRSFVSEVACICWTVHYAKRVLESIFVHRFSHASMPLLNLFKNCGYYWLFTLFIAYPINHYKYTPPSSLIFYLGLTIFALSELGNLSIHLALRSLRPEGTSTRKIPKPTGNVFTLAFNYVSCPNYLYEVGAWVGFAIMTHCTMAFIFAFAGAAQMALWAKKKHINYIKEFSNYPKNRKAMFPFLY